MLMVLPWTERAWDDQEAELDSWEWKLGIDQISLNVYESFAYTCIWSNTE